jgi:hypothetical protein
MREWLKLMLEEIRRRESEALERQPAPDSPGRSKSPGGEKRRDETGGGDRQEAPGPDGGEGP